MPKLNKFLSLILSFCLILEQGVFAQTIDLSHYFARNPAQTIPQSDKFRPLHLRYISYDNQANDFKILLDKGDAVGNGLKPFPTLEDATQELMKYFFIGLALPNEKFWVNLRPDSPDNILDPDLEKTDIGRIFLEADLQLKKDTSSMTSPQTKEGREYWNKLYKKAGELFGTENITIPTITRPWIVPNEIIIREAPDNAYIYKATLKVMLEEDYLDQKTEKPKNGKTEELKNQRTDWHSFSDPRLKELNQYSTQLIKETIIPKLTYAVNTSKRYAPLRQVYYSLILAQWFKQKYGSVRSTRAQGTRAPANSYVDLINSGNLTNLISKEPYDKQTYFQQYQKSFQDGEYNLQEPVYTPMGQSIRRYISGGIALEQMSYQPTGESILIMPPYTLEALASGTPDNLRIAIQRTRDALGRFANEKGKSPEDMIRILNSSEYKDKLFTMQQYRNLWKDRYKDELPQSTAYSDLHRAIEKDWIKESEVEYYYRLTPQGKAVAKEIMPIVQDTQLLSTAVSLATDPNATRDEDALHIKSSSSVNIPVMLKNYNHLISYITDLIVKRKQNSGKSVFLVSLNGEWGAGKSTLLDNIVKHLTLKKIKVVIVKRDWFIRDRAERTKELQDFKVGLLAKLPDDTRMDYFEQTRSKVKAFSEKPFGNLILDLDNLYSESTGKVDESQKITIEPNTVVIFETGYGSEGQGAELFDLRLLVTDAPRMRLERIKVRYQERHMDEPADLETNFWRRVQKFNDRLNKGVVIADVFIYMNGFNQPAMILADPTIPSRSLIDSIRRQKGTDNITDPVDIVRKLVKKIIVELESQSYPNSIDKFGKDMDNVIKFLSNIIKRNESMKYKTLVKIIMEKFIPICYALGYSIRGSNIRDLCFSILYPREAESYKSAIGDRVRGVDLAAFAEKVAEVFRLKGVRFKIEHRLKTGYSTYLKNPKEISLDKIDDLFGIRVWVDVPEGKTDFDALYDALSALADLPNDWVINKYTLHKKLYSRFHIKYKVGSRDTPVEMQVRLASHKFAFEGLAYTKYKHYAHGKYISERNRSLFPVFQRLDQQGDERKYHELLLKIYHGGINTERELIRGETAKVDDYRISKIPGVYFILDQNVRLPIENVIKIEKNAEDVESVIVTIEGKAALETYTSKIIHLKSETKASGASPQSATPPPTATATAIDDQTSSPLTLYAPGTTGGIDFRSLPIVTRSMDNLKVSIRAIPKGSLKSINLTQEWSDIERLVNSGIIPSAERIKDYFAAICFKGNLNSDMERIVSCISDILRLEEESCCSTDQTLKDILVVLGYGRNQEELKAIFSGAI